ncbi:MAG: DNA/RNA non-specific endonuclease [Nitrospirae bacterium]|nr:MAG: DNA/RNA non-specific endonuclease [Nitrospirota bacterium]
MPLIALLVFTTLVYAGPFDNCAEYTKMGIPSEQGTPLCRKGYALAYNPENKTPDWVAEHLTKDKASAHMGRKNYFAPDPDLPQGARAELVDYKRSGFDRGHMAPAGDMRWDLEAYKESFYLSNMVPQVGRGMNQGIWKDLEEMVRQWALTRGELYIYTGPVYDEALDAVETIGDDEVAIPTHLFKIVYDPKRKEAIAFLMPNEPLRTEDMPKYLVSVDRVEKKTGFDFLSALSQQEQRRIESKKAVGLWK